jgi:hypothetical protein
MGTKVVVERLFGVEALTNRDQGKYSYNSLLPASNLTVIIDSGQISN